MKWLQRDGGEDLHSDPPRFRIIRSTLGCVACDDASGAVSNLFESQADAEEWCKWRDKGDGLDFPQA